ncbi:uncharacterized protein MONOS_2733 [Monocercomonoides exilis]|uniref:uncharacterized protein n=1 Tax=Monocercomonoides exilis TaxID=2049356 RepID=UPI00355A6D80|nr:hypothetical protein MONOS_2733 [Monocercomonoides exilis]|eukprot:MONOS_2733.1-p1 / transcript=MONOS_2733.1 / gene=MONOS_2733 / organism=Monocercomonoides_exilis_PA203 / gene_product=unspecified product / transcript_product=unspecified product / location=Mono_scaffold00058:21423-21752(+) / protein_length=109 / sequence_SO=supercontig / SO=protein_coding / is_pseudo=false
MNSSVRSSSMEREGREGGGGSGGINSREGKSGSLIGDVGVTPVRSPSRAIHRSSLRVLPNMLFVHLRRFDIDQSTFQRKKVNSFFRFPLDEDLDLSPLMEESREHSERE